MSAREPEPLWFCHQCRAEMRPLMTPNPICASCRGSFVEKLENPADDPRDFQNRGPDLVDTPNSVPGAFDGLPRSGTFSTTENSPTQSPLHPSRFPSTQQSASPNTGFRFEFHSGPGGGTRTVITSGSNTLRRSPPLADRSVPTMLEFLRRETENSNNPRPNGNINGHLMAQYILALFGPHDHGDPFAELMGVPPPGRWGDYVFNQEALDQILTQLTENATAGRPVPATEQIIDDLPREVLAQGSPLLEKDCAVCKEQFRLDPDDPDELIVVTLPCKHSFHEGCILPWLKSSGTCPVCRFALVAQPQQHSGGPSGGSSNTNRTNTSSGLRPNSSRNSDRGGAGGLFHSLFGGGSGLSSGSSDSHSARSRRNSNHNTRPQGVSRSTPPFPGRWIEDID